MSHSPSNFLIHNLENYKFSLFLISFANNFYKQSKDSVKKWYKKTYFYLILFSDEAFSLSGSTFQFSSIKIL